MLLSVSVFADSHTSELTPQIQADLYFLQAETYIEAGNRRAADETLEKIFALNKSYSLSDDFHYQYARVLFMREDYDEAASSIESYLNIAGRSGEHYEDALRLLLDVVVAKEELARDSTAYQAARDKGTLEALREYLATYPNGKHADEARQAIAKMEADAAAERDERAYDDAMKKGDIEALQGYLDAFPEGKHAAEVRATLEEMRAAEAERRDRQAYENALNLGTSQAFCAYLEDYPRGMHGPEAKALAEYFRPGRTFSDCDEQCPEMVVVNAESYKMGSPQDESGHRPDETIRHVTIERPFAVGVYETKLAEFRKFADQKIASENCWVYVGDEWKERSEYGWKDPGYRQTDEHPVVCVNWNDSRHYVDWLSENTGNNYRLLSEAEWEYVARAGTTTPFHYGETISSSQANFDGEYAMPVGSYESNDFGLHDVHGNVWEWVGDCRNDGHADDPSNGTAWEQKDCENRLLRGGGWNVGAEFVRSSIRGWNVDGFRGSSNGFRVARALDVLDVGSQSERSAVIADLSTEFTSQTCPGQI